MGKKSRKNRSKRPATSNSNKGASAARSVDSGPSDDPFVATTSTSVKSDLLQIPVAQNAAPATTSTTTTTKVLVLVSKQSVQRAVTQKQQTALLVLHSNGIPFTMMDGSNPANKARRNELFAISGCGANVYPQFFLLQTDNNSGDANAPPKTTFWGDFDAFEAANDNGSLVEEMMGTGGAGNGANSPADEGVRRDVWGSKLRDAVGNSQASPTAVLDVTMPHDEEDEEDEKPANQNPPSPIAVLQDAEAKRTAAAVTAAAPTTVATAATANKSATTSTSKSTSRSIPPLEPAPKPAVAAKSAPVEPSPTLDLNAPAPDEAKSMQKDCECSIL